jgi:hypothetical protein
MKRVAIWLVGVVLCCVFIFCLWPTERAGDRWWSLPVTWQLLAFFSGGCCVILALTYAIDRIAVRRSRKPN